MHTWGDKDFDWNGLNKAMMMIVNELKKYRIPIRQYKEKYGFIRIYCSLGWHCLLDITHPGHVQYRAYPKPLMLLDIFYLSKIISYISKYTILPLHKIVYRNAYKKACDKYPHLFEEICWCADFIKLLDFYKNKEE